MALKNNTWKLNQWYDQNVAGNISYSGTKEFWFWGKQESGSWGINIGGTIYRSSPVQLPGTTWQTEFYNNHNASWTNVMTKTDGTLWSWGGKSGYGELGLNEQGPSVRYSSPVQIGSDTDWKLGGTMREGAFAIKTDGTLWTWGDARFGALGQNSLTARSSPTQVGSDTTWDKAYGGQYNMLAIKTDGTLWTWGPNEYGALGLNQHDAHRSSPTQIPGSWSQASLNSTRSGALNTDGELFLWGANYGGWLGQNNTTQYSSPVQVPGTWSYYEQAGEGAAGRKTDGTLWAWGTNSHGQLGQNQAEAQLDRISSPIQIGSDTSWDRISMSGNVSMATKTDGTLWTWGFNNAGCLGQNQAPAQLAATSSPVQVPGTSWLTVGHSGQGYQMMATKNV